MRPITGKILVKLQPIEDKTKGGLVLPYKEESNIMQAEVIAIGKPKPNTESEVEIGDIILFGKHSGVTVNYEGIDYLVINQHDIYLIK